MADLPAVGSLVPQMVLPAKPDWGKASQGVQCFVQSSKSSYVVGEPIIVKFWAKNVSQYELMYLKPDVQDDKSRFWRIEPRTLLTRIKPQAQGSLRKSDYILLSPGGVSSGKVDVTTIYSFKPGSYTIRAHHTGANWYRRSDGAITEMDGCWTGTVTSNEVSVTITATRSLGQALAVSVKIRDGTGKIERENMHFTTVWVSGMSLVFTVKNQTSRPVDPGLSESVLLVNEKPLRDWGFIVGGGPRDERWRNLPPGEEIVFTYGMGKYFAKTGHYRVQLVLGEAKSNVAEISVSPHCK